MKRTLIFAATLSLLALPVVALAQTQSQNGFVPLASVSGTMLQSAYQSQTLSSYFNAIFKIALSVGAILAVLQIVRAGYLYMGSDIWSKKDQAKEIFGDAIIGLLILLSVWLILYQINPDILNLDVTRDFSTGSNANNAAQQTNTPAPAP